MTGEALQQSLLNQRDFATAVSHTMRNDTEGMPLVFIYCSVGDILLPDGYQIALQSNDYSEGRLRELAQRLLGVIST